MCDLLELSLALLGSLAIGVTRWAMRLGGDAARATPAPGVEDGWDMV